MELGSYFYIEFKINFYLRIKVENSLLISSYHFVSSHVTQT
jgi:hypothetical protein